MLRGEISLGELIRLVRVRAERETSYGVYAADADCDGFASASRVYVGRPPDLDPAKDFEPILPADVVERGLETFCSDDLLRDVVDHAVTRKPGVTVDEIVHGLAHYFANDDFMDYASTPAGGAVA